jgi:hypothetical protein
MITHEELKRVLRYEPESGQWYWNVSPCRRIKAGSPAGSVFRDGNERPRARIGVGKKYYSSSRLAWFYMTGEWPQHDVLHKNGDSADYRWANLKAPRPVERTRNENTTGMRGVSRANSKWKAIYGRRYLGVFDSAEAAHAAYTSAKTEAGNG